MEEAERLLTVYDVAQRLSVTEKTVDNWVRAGKFPAPMLLGHRRRWPANIFESIWDQHLSSSKGPATPQPTEEEIMAIYFGPDAEPVLISADEACAMLHCSRVELYRMCQSGDLQTVEVSPGHRRFKLADVYAYQSANLSGIARRMKTEQFIDENPDLQETA